MNLMSTASTLGQIGVNYLGNNTPVPRGIINIVAPDGTKWPDQSVQCWIEESHKDELEISQHPVEYGASITDHAFKRPSEVVVKVGWSNSPTADSGWKSTLQGLAVANSPLAASVSNAYSLYQGAQSALNGADPGQINGIYAYLLAMQRMMCLFSLETTKLLYDDLLIKSISTETDSRHANDLVVTLVCQQVILVETSVIDLKLTNQKSAETMTPNNLGLTSLSAELKTVASPPTLPSPTLPPALYNPPAVSTGSPLLGVAY